MEVRPGYKETKIGPLPEDWSCERVRDAAANRANAIVGGPFGSDLVSADYVPHGIPVIRGQNMAGGTVAGDFVFVLPEKAKRLRANLAHSGDLVFTQRGTLGQVSIVPGEAFEAYLVSQSQMKVSLNRERHDPGFLRQYFASQFGQKQILDSAIQTGVPHTNLGILRNYCFPAPGLSEQQEIEAALGDVDALLDGLERLIAKKRDLKQAAMQQLLTGQTRLPGFSGGWEVRPLASVIANLEAGVSVNSVEQGKPLRSGEPCILKTSAIFDGRFDPEECKLIDRFDISRAKLIPRRDTIIISRMNTPNLVGEVGYVPRDFPTLFLPDRLWMTRFDPNADICARWLAYLMSSSQVKESIKELGTGTSGSMKNIGKSTLLALPLAFPTGEEQTAIAAVLSDMDAELSALVARRDKTRDLKQAMMQELLTGRTRLV
jgi:type I restriction enzyme S subunit